MADSKQTYKVLIDDKIAIDGKNLLLNLFLKSLKFMSECVNADQTSSFLWSEFPDVNEGLKDQCNKMDEYIEFKSFRENICIGWKNLINRKKSAERRILDLHEVWDTIGRLGRKYKLPYQSIQLTDEMKQTDFTGLFRILLSLEKRLDDQNEELDMLTDINAQLKIEYGRRIQEETYEKERLKTQYEEKMKLPENKTEAHNVSLENVLKARTNEIKELKSELDRSKLKYRKAVKDTKQLQKQLQVQRPQTAPVHNSREMQAKIENLKREMTFYMELSQTLRNEKDSLMQRLSKVAGTKMKDNNPSIADPNRPERLAEQFRKIYHNAWMDLLDDLNDVTGEPDAVCVQTIMDILQNIYNGCEEQIRKRMGNMLKCLGYTHDDMKKQYDGGKNGHDPTVIIIKDLIKNSVGRMLEAISKRVEENEKIDNIFKTVGKKSAQTFVSKCTEICIYMCVQDPPVVLDFSFKSDDTFNKDCLNPFTKTGEVIDFVVWPVMYLFKDGTMMSKGIAQGKKKSSKIGGGTEGGKDMPNPGKGRNQAAKKIMVTSDDDNDVVTPSEKKDKSAQKQKSKKSKEPVIERKAENVAKETTSNEALEIERKTASIDKTKISIFQDKSKEVINPKL